MGYSKSAATKSAAQSTSPSALPPQIIETTSEVFNCRRMSEIFICRRTKWCEAFKGRDCKVDAVGCCGKDSDFGYVYFNSRCSRTLWLRLRFTQCNRHPIRILALRAAPMHHCLRLMTLSVVASNSAFLLFALFRGYRWIMIYESVNRQWRHGGRNWLL